MYRHILVPTDGSACSEKATEHAVALAKVEDSSIVFLFVMDAVRNYHEGVMPDVRKMLSAEGERSLARSLAIAADAGIQADAELVEGIPADVILQRAEDFDLLVMGSHGKGLWKQVTVGSVTQEVLRHTTRPVLLVPCGEARSTG